MASHTNDTHIEYGLTLTQHRVNISRLLGLHMILIYFLCTDMNRVMNSRSARDGGHNVYSSAVSSYLGSVGPAFLVLVFNITNVVVKHLVKVPVL